MRKSAIIIYMLAYLLAPQLASEPEFTGVQQPNEAEKVVIDGLHTDIEALQKRIETFYPDLKNKNLIANNGTTKIPLKADIQTSLGSRTQFVYNEEARIRWQGSQISAFSFFLRKAHFGTQNLVRKTLTGNVIIRRDGHEEPNPIPANLELAVTEIQEPGPGSQVKVIFRFPNRETARNAMDAQGNRVVYLRQTKQRIGLLREYYRLLDLLLRRVDWLVRNENNKHGRIVDQFVDD